MRKALMMVAVLLVAHSVSAGQGIGIPNYKASIAADGRLLFTMTAKDFTFSRATDPKTGVTEIAIGGDPISGPLTIRLGGPQGLILERNGEVIDVRSGADPDAIRALTRGPAVRAFRLALGNYERQLADDPATLTETVSPVAYSALLTAAFVGEMAGDPNALGRTRDLIRRRIAAKIHLAAWTMKFDCVDDYERALLYNDDRQTQCMESANNQPWYVAGGERLLCAAEFLAGALAAEGQFVKCAAWPKVY